MSVNIDKLISAVLKVAAAKRENAAHGGEWGDGGAGTLEEQVKFYNYGRNGVTPPEWKGCEIELDPEYAEYKRLKEKFQ